MAASAVEADGGIILTMVQQPDDWWEFTWQTAPLPKKERRFDWRWKLLTAFNPDVGF